MRKRMAKVKHLQSSCKPGASLHSIVEKLLDEVSFLTDMRKQVGEFLKESANQEYTECVQAAVYYFTNIIESK